MIFRSALVMMVACAREWILTFDSDGFTLSAEISTNPSQSGKAHDRGSFFFVLPSHQEKEMLF